MSQDPILQLRKGRDVEIGVVIEDPNSATDHGASIKHRQKCETDARRNIVFAGNVVAVIANAVLKCQPAIQSPLVLQVSEKLRLVTAEPAIALIVELLAPGSVGSQNAHGAAPAAPVASNVTDSAATLPHV